MTSDPFDPFEPKEQTKASAARSSSFSPRHHRDPGSAPGHSRPAQAPSAATPAVPAKATAKPPVVSSARRISFRELLDGPGGIVARFAIAFAIAGVAALFLLVAVAMGVSSNNADRILSGVHVGGVDLSGDTRQEAIVKLQAAYAYLSEGEVTIATPLGSATITYEQAGRAPDVEAMADAAMSVGHTGDAIADTAAALRAASGGQDIPIIVRVDPEALSARIRQIVGSSMAGARDAQVTVTDGAFTVAPASAGQGVDEKTISDRIITELTDGDAPADIEIPEMYVNVQPKVTDAQAATAIDEARKLIVDVTVTWDQKSWKIPAATIQSWIVFGARADGSYGPAVDPNQIATWLSGTPSKSNVPAVEPTVVWNNNKTVPVGLNPGQDGIGIDVTSTTQTIAAYLDGLATGGSVADSLAVTTAPIHAKITDTSIKGMVVIGSWTTQFYSDQSNGYGANIRIPAGLLNGDVIAPGQQFSFLREVGPIDAAHGFKPGGVIIDGHSDHTGAMGGGICSASTTMFNAAARAGLQIDERHAHFYYINRYPIGLDATVYSDGSRVWDLKWTNDTPYPIIIRGSSTRSSITFQLWSLPLDRKTVFAPNPGPKNAIVTATDTTVYVGNKSLKPGQTYRAEYPTDGFDTLVNRTVTDANGNILHKDVFKSHYTKVDGLLQVGATASPTPSPSPTPTPGPATPTPAITPTPTPTPSGRRRPR